MAGQMTSLAPLPGLQDDNETVTKAPKLYKVLLHNDDFTPQNFVVHILMKYFKKPSEEAEHIMLSVHQEGVGLAGIYPLEIAETKCYKVISEARKNEYPLMCSVEVKEA